MQKQLHKLKDQKGFTIIEVLIVLAIAGLIMVVVFLAVPALQRSGRNNALNTDANNLLSGIGTYVSNNGGSLPNALSAGYAAGGQSLTLTNSGAGTHNNSTVKLGGNLDTVTFSTASTATPGTTNVGRVVVVTGNAAICNADGTGLAGTTTGSTRSYAILYTAEGATANFVKCVGS